MQYLPIYDLMFKKIFTSRGHEDLLKGFVNTILGTNFKSVTPIVPYHIDQYEKENYNSVETLFRTEADLLAITENGEPVTIEVQIQKHSMFVERTIYYVCKAYTDNYKKETPHSKFKKLTPVFSINITNFNLFPETNNALHVFHLKDKNSDIHLKTKQGTPLLTVAYFSLTAPITDKNSLLYQWQNYFKYGKIDNVENAYLKQAQKYLDEQLLTQKEKELLDMLTKQQSIQWEIEEEMREQLKEKFENGFNDGFNSGFNNGFENGFEDGAKQSVIKTAKNMLSKHMDEQLISEITGLSLEEIRAL